MEWYVNKTTLRDIIFLVSMTMKGLGYVITMTLSHIRFGKSNPLLKINEVISCTKHVYSR